MGRFLPKKCDHCGVWYKSGAGLSLHLRSIGYIKERFTLMCARKGCDNTFEVVKSKMETRKYCSKSCSGKINQTGKVFSEEHRKKISEAKKEQFARDPKSNPFYGRTPTNYLGWGTGGYVEELGYSVRSSWERKYLLALKDAGVYFVYEPRRFDLGDCTYLPDLQLDETTFVEITGWDKPGKAEKRDKFTKMYSDFTLHVWKKTPTKKNVLDFVELCRG